MICNSVYFEFDGKSSKDFIVGEKGISLRIIQTEDSELKAPIFGGNYDSMDEAGSFNGIFLNFGNKLDVLEYQFKVILCKEYYNSQLETEPYHFEPIEITRKYREEIARWLFKGKYGMLSFDHEMDLVFVAKFQKGSEREIIQYNDIGYLTLNVKFGYPHPFTRSVTNNFTNYNAEKIVTVDNISNVDGYTYPTLKIQTLESETNISIENLTTHEIVEFKNLPPDIVIEMYCDTKEISTNNSSYVYGKKDNFNRKWFRLMNNTYNEIKIKGKCKIAIETPFEILQ